MPAPRGKFLQAVLVLIVAALVFRFGIRPPMPLSVFSLYMAIIADGACWSSSRRTPTPGASSSRRSGRRSPTRAGARCASSSVVVIPLLLGLLRLHAGRRARRRPRPSSARSIRRRRPRSASAARRSTSSTPTSRCGRTQAEPRERGQARGSRRARSTSGTACTATATSWTARATSPTASIRRRPNFVGPGTIAMLQRPICSGGSPRAGRGCPKESTPWNSAMPAWEDRLTEEQIWQVIFYLYEATGQPPRVRSRTPRGRSSRARAPGSSPAAPTSSPRVRRRPRAATWPWASACTRCAARAATAPTARATAPPPSSWSRAPATSRPGSTRSAPRTGRSRPTRICSTS